MIKKKVLVCIAIAWETGHACPSQEKKGHMSAAHNIVVQNVLPVVSADFERVNQKAQSSSPALRAVLSDSADPIRSPPGKYIIGTPVPHEPWKLGANIVMRQGRVLGVPKMRAGMTPYESSGIKTPDYQANTVVLASAGVSMEYSDITQPTVLGKKISAMLNLLIDNRIGMVVGIGNKRESGLSPNGEHPPWELNPLSIYQSSANMTAWKHMLRTTGWDAVQNGGADINTRYLPAFRHYVLEVDWMGRMRESTMVASSGKLRTVDENDATLPHSNHVDFGDGFESVQMPYVMRVSYEQPLDLQFDPMLQDVVVWRPFVRYRPSQRDEPGLIDPNVLTQYLSVDLIKIEVVDWASQSVVRTHRFVMIDEKTWRDNGLLVDLHMPDGQVWDGDMHQRYLLSLVQRYLWYPTSTGLDVVQVPTHRALIHCHAGIGRTGVMACLLAGFSPTGQANLTPYQIIMQLRFSRLSPMVYSVQQWALIYNMMIFAQSNVSFCTCARTWLACGALRLEYLVSRLQSAPWNKASAWKTQAFHTLETELITPYKQMGKSDVMGVLPANTIAALRKKDLSLLVNTLKPGHFTHHVLPFDRVATARAHYYDLHVGQREYKRCVLSWRHSGGGANNNTTIYTVPPTTAGILNAQEYVLDLQQLFPSNNIVLLSPTIAQLKKGIKVRLNEYNDLIPYPFKELEMRVNVNGNNHAVSLMRSSRHDKRRRGGGDEKHASRRQGHTHRNKKHHYSGRSHRQKDGPIAVYMHYKK